MKLKYWDKNKEYFDDIPEDDYKALKEDIKANGLINPLHVLEDGTVICGNQRLKACRELNISDDDISIKILTLKDNREITLYAIKENLLRRQLTLKQKAKPVGVYIQLKEELEKERWGGDRKSEEFQVRQDVTLEKLRTSDIIAKDLGVGSGRTLDRLIQYNKIIEEKPELKLKHESMAGAVREYKKLKFLEEKENEVKKDFPESLLIHGDCSLKLKDIEDKSVDLVVTDSPYGVDFIERTNSGKDDNNSNRLESFNKNFVDGKNYALEILDKACKELQRVCKDDAHLYFFFGITNYEGFYSILKKYFIVDAVPLIWLKSNFPIGRDVDKQYMLLYETVFFCKNKNTNKYLNYKSSPNVLKYNIVQGKMHPTQKPVDLLEYFILNSSQEGDMVLDCFMGSGSTIIASLKNKRKCIGIELDEEYINITKKRMQTELN